jgi:hypothetical protein
MHNAKAFLVFSTMLLVSCFKQLASSTPLPTSKSFSQPSLTSIADLIIDLTGGCALSILLWFVIKYSGSYTLSVNNVNNTDTLFSPPGVHPKKLCIFFLLHSCLPSNFNRHNIKVRITIAAPNALLHSILSFASFLDMICHFLASSTRICTESQDIMSELQCPFPNLEFWITLW